MEKSIEKAKKIIEVKNDINELTEVLNCPKKLRNNGVDVFNRIFYKLDYKPYIFKFTKKYNLKGNLTFEQLDFKFKIKVLKMLKDSICDYVEKEIGKEVLDNILNKNRA